MVEQQHRAARLESRIHRVVESNLLRRGWVPRLVPFAGYGTTTWVRILLRVLLVPPGSPPPRTDRTGAGAPTDLRGWRRFVSATAVGVPVQVTIGDTTHEVRTDRDGYVDVVLPAALDPGWQTVSLALEGARDTSAAVRVVGPATRLGLVSDLDDTVIVTMLPRPVQAFRNAFVIRESARTPVQGMARMYADVLASHPDVFVVYLSTGAWNTAGAVTRFLHHHGFPRGPLLMTDWGPTTTGWFRSGTEHKTTQLRRLLEDLPDLGWLLVGDDGQHDPAIYGELATDHPDRVAAIAIRELSLGERMAGRGVPVARDEPGPAGVVEVRAEDGFGLRDALRARGVIP